MCIYNFVACFDKAIESFGTLDIIINNAGIMNDVDWEPMVDINYVSHALFIIFIGNLSPDILNLSSL